MSYCHDICVWTAKRKDFSREGLLDMLQEAFSNDDTSGENGEDYYTLAPDKSDDEVMREKYLDESIPEDTVITEYAEWFFESEYDSVHDYKVDYENGRAVYIARASCY